MNKYIRVLGLLLIVAILMLFGLSGGRQSDEARLAKLFYEKHYHKVLKGAYGENLDQYFEKEENMEIVVYLDNLVVYNSRKMIEILQKMPCKLMKSKLIIKPKAPYGPKDYKYIVHCEVP